MSIFILTAKSPKSREMFKRCGPSLGISSPRGGRDPPGKRTSTPPRAVCVPSLYLFFEAWMQKFPFLTGSCWTTRSKQGHDLQPGSPWMALPQASPCTGMAPSAQTPWAMSQGATGPLPALVSPKATSNIVPSRTSFMRGSILREGPFLPPHQEPSQHRSQQLLIKTKPISSIQPPIPPKGCKLHPTQPGLFSIPQGSS